MAEFHNGFTFSCPSTAHNCVMDQGGACRGEGSPAGVQRVGVTMSDLAFRWTNELLNHGRSPLTAKCYGGALSRFGKWLDGYRIEFKSVTREDAEQWLGDLRISGLKPSSIRSQFTIVREFYRWLVALDYIPKDPFGALKGIKVPVTLQQVFSVSDIDRMAKACESARELALVETLYSTGVRRAGLLGMRLGDLDLDGGRAKVRLKGGSESYVLLNAKAVAALQNWLRVRQEYVCLKRAPTDLLWLGRNGPISNTQLAGIIHGIASRAGFSGATPHAFRRTFATALSDNDVKIEDIKELMGHKHIAATQLYIRYSTARIREAWKKLPRQ